MSDAVAKTARLFAEPARVAMLLSLMGGRAVPAGELAITAHVSPQTASEHLARLIEAGFVTARRYGRHRYYELTNAEVAQVVESLLVLSAAPGAEPDARSVRPVLGSLKYARTCYAHLAGWLGVAIADGLRHEGFLIPAAGSAFSVTDSGREWFEQRGIAVPASRDAADPRLARQCPDWTERRPHLGGTLGVMMYKRFLELGWLAPSMKSRAVRVTLVGRQVLSKYLHIVAG